MADKRTRKESISSEASTEGTITTSGESDGSDNDPTYKPNGPPQKAGKAKKKSFLSRIFSRGKADKNEKREPQPPKPKANNEMIASQSVKMPTTDAPPIPPTEDPVPATVMKLRNKLSAEEKAMIVEQNAKFQAAQRDPIQIAALKNERKKVLVGNLKPYNEHKICSKLARETTKYLKAKVEQKQQIDDNEKLPKIGDCIESKSGHKYTVVKVIGKGCFGCVYLVKNEEGDYLAMKCNLKAGNIGIKYDCKVLHKALTINSSHFCTLIDSGKKAGDFKFIVMDLADTDVSKLLNEKKTLSIGTAVAIAQQSLLGLQDLHSMGYLHRDIKAENVVLCAGEKYQMVKLIDFGMSGKLPTYEDQHVADIPPSVPYLVGNMKTASIAALKNQKQSRKDDLESWMYFVFELFGVEFKWHGEFDICKMIQIKERLQKPGKIQQQFFSKLPPGILTIFEYVVSMEYCQVPDYMTLHSILGFIIQISKLPRPFFVDFDLMKAYVAPPYSETYIPAVKEKAPYYYPSTKGGHLNAVVNGQPHNFNRMVPGKEDVAVFICGQKDEKGIKCNRPMEVKGFNDNSTQTGEFVHVLNIAKKHKCGVYRKKKEKDVGQDGKDRKVEQDEKGGQDGTDGKRGKCRKGGKGGKSSEA